MRIRWFEPDDPTAPIDWSVAAAILAPLFLNFLFWLAVADRFWTLAPLPGSALVMGGVALLATAISVAGPWLAATRQNSLSLVLADSFGALPARALRWICAAFAILWLSSAVSLPVRLWVSYREEPLWHAYVLAAALLALLGYSGLQSFTTEAKLGLFTSKLALALLAAALWRVRDGWSAIPIGLQRPDVGSLRYGVIDLATYLVPFSLLATDLVARMRSRKDAALAATAGIAVPLFGVLLLTATIGQATWRSYIYQPSLIPTVNMALYGKVAWSALPGRWAIGAITVFGVARFCIRSISAGLPPTLPRRPVWVLMGASACWRSLHPFAPAFENAVRFLAACLGVMSAITTADCLIRHRAVSRRINWTGCAAFAIGLLPMIVLRDPWQSWLLPCYAAAFIACLAGRMLERAIDPQLLQLLHRD